MHTTLTQVTRLCALCLCLLAGSPGWAQEAKEPTKLELHVLASDQANPDETARPSPVKVRIYELKDSTSFAEADYFSLNNTDKTVLGADLLVRDEFILRPGETRTIDRKSHPQATTLGILAGYRDLSSTWRVVHPLPEAPAAAWYRIAMPSNKAALTIQLEPQGIVVKPTP